MIPLIKARWETYCNRPFDNWMLRKELSLPLEPEQPADSINYRAPVIQVPWLEKIFFKLYTGLDLQRIRQYKVSHSPRFKQLALIGNKKESNIAKQHSNVACDQIRLHTCFRDITLEAYWVDRELSIYITNLDALEETLKNHRVTWCQGKNCDPKDTWFQLSGTHPIENRLGDDVIQRLNRLPTNCAHEPDYNEATDTFHLVPYEKSIFRKIVSIPEAMCHLDNWANTSLTKRLAKDRERRSLDARCKLLFVHNEMYEELLKKHQMKMTAYWATGLAVISLAAMVFFCQLTKGRP
jgi:hypothetical protein